MDIQELNNIGAYFNSKLPEITSLKRKTDIAKTPESKPLPVIESKPLPASFLGHQYIINKLNDTYTTFINENTRISSNPTISRVLEEYLNLLALVENKSTAVKDYPSCSDLINELSTIHSGMIQDPKKEELKGLINKHSDTMVNYVLKKVPNDYHSSVSLGHELLKLTLDGKSKDNLIHGYKQVQKSNNWVDLALFGNTCYDIASVIIDKCKGEED